MVLYRAPERNSLELARSHVMDQLVRRVQGCWRGFMVRQHMKVVLANLANIKAAIRTRTVAALDAALAPVADVEYSIPFLDQARLTRIVVQKEEALIAEFNALLTQDADEVRAQIEVLLKKARELPLPATCDVFERSELVLEICRRRRSCEDELEHAAATKDEAALDAALGTAASLGLKGERVEAAALELAKIQGESKLLESLAVALNCAGPAAADIKALRTVITSAQAIELTSVIAKEKVRAAELLLEAAEAYQMNETARLAELAEAAADLDIEGGHAMAGLVDVAVDSSAYDDATPDSITTELIEAGQKMTFSKLRVLLSKCEKSNIQNATVEWAKQIMQCIVAVRDVCNEGVRTRDPVTLSKGVRYAQHYGYQAHEVSTAMEMLRDLAVARVVCYRAATCVGRAYVERGVRLANATGLDDEMTKWCRQLLTLPPHKFREAELGAATKSFDKERRVYLEGMDLTERMEFVPNEYKMELWGKLRDPKVFFKSRLGTGKGTVKDMLTWQKDPIKTSISLVSEAVLKPAVRMFKTIMTYMGDAKGYSEPGDLVDDIVKLVYREPTIRDEIIVQVLKQVTKNPREESKAKGFELLGMCLQTFGPSDEFFPYVNLALLRMGPLGKPFIERMRDVTLFQMPYPMPNGRDLVEETRSGTYKTKFKAEAPQVLRWADVRCDLWDGLDASEVYYKADHIMRECDNELYGARARAEEMQAVDFVPSFDIGDDDLYGSRVLDALPELGSGSNNFDDVPDFVQPDLVKTVAGDLSTLQQIGSNISRALDTGINFAPSVRSPLGLQGSTYDLGVAPDFSGGNLSGDLGLGGGSVPSFGGAVPDFSSTTEAVATVAPDGRAVTSTVRAMYAYTEQQPGVLNFNVGDLIFVVDQPEGEWWSGFVEGGVEVCYFPKAYVESA